MYKKELTNLKCGESYIIPQGLLFPKCLLDIKQYYDNKYDLRFSYFGDIYIKVNYLHQNTSQCIADSSFCSNEIADATLSLDLSCLEDGTLEVSVIAMSDAQIFLFSKPCILSANAIEPSQVLYDFSFPSSNLCNEESLYFQLSDNVSHFSYNDRSVTLLGDSNVDFLTYFNAFSSIKWTKFTNVKNVSVYLDLVGNVEVRIVGFYKNDRLILDCYTVNASERGIYTFPVSVPFDEMLIGVEISNIPVSVTDNPVLSKAEHLRSDLNSYDSDNPDSVPSRKLTFAPAVIYGGGWLTTDEQIQDVALGIVISALNRESQVACNVARLTSDIAAHPFYHDRISVTVLDNGGNLTPDDFGCKIFDINHKIWGGGGV